MNVTTRIKEEIVFIDNDSRHIDPVLAKLTENEYKTQHSDYLVDGYNYVSKNCNSIKIVVLDVQFPLLDDKELPFNFNGITAGIQFYKNLKEICEDIYVIYYTVCQKDSFYQAFHDEYPGIDLSTVENIKYVHKFDEEALIDVIENIFEN